MKLKVYLACFIALGSSLLPAYTAPAATNETTVTVPNISALQTAVPDTSTALGLIKSYAPDVAQYLQDPNTVCTFFCPTNEAIQASMQRLGKYGGIAAQNYTLQAATFGYLVIPGKALTTSDLMQINDASTYSGETMYIFHKNGQPLVYARPDLPVSLNQTNIKAGKCIVHTINMAIVPPSAEMMVDRWLYDQGTFPPVAAPQDWAPVRTDLQQQLLEIGQAGGKAAAVAGINGAMAPSDGGGAAGQQTDSAGVVTGGAALAIGVAAAAVLVLMD